MTLLWIIGGTLLLWIIYSIIVGGFWRSVLLAILESDGCSGSGSGSGSSSSSNRDSGSSSYNSGGGGDSGGGGASSDF